MSAAKPKALYIVNEPAYNVLYKDTARRVARLVDVYAPPQLTPRPEPGVLFIPTLENIADPAVLRDMEILLTGWGGVKMDERFLAACPNLTAVFYAAGSIRGLVTDAFWDRNIPITSAWDANATPVAEYVFSQIIWLLKKGWRYAFEARDNRRWAKRVDVPGAYGTTVGLISLGLIARRVVRFLKLTDMKVIAYDPFVSKEDARKLGVELVGLDEVFRRGDVVSLHTPWLPETVGMITGEHFRMMKPGAAFINTARGAVIREKEMIEVLKSRPDIWAVLDVTHPEPPPPGSDILNLPNVIVTPHIAGAMNKECNRNGQYMLEELRRYLAGKPLKWSIDRNRARLLA